MILNVGGVIDTKYLRGLKGVGAARDGFGSDSVIGAASAACPGAAGETTSGLLNTRGVPNAILADGPAGLRLSKHFAADARGNVIPGLDESALGAWS